LSPPDLLTTLRNIAFLSSFSTDLASGKTLKDLPVSSISTNPLTECTSQQQQPLSSLQIGLPTEGATSRQPSTAENSLSALQIPSNGLTVSSLSEGYQLAGNLTESSSMVEEGISNDTSIIELFDNFCSQ
jgi:hypothetical protein